MIPKWCYFIDVFIALWFWILGFIWTDLFVVIFFMGVGYPSNIFNVIIWRGVVTLFQEIAMSLLIFFQWV